MRCGHRRWRHQVERHEGVLQERRRAPDGHAVAGRQLAVPLGEGDDGGLLQWDAAVHEAPTDWKSGQSCVLDYILMADKIEGANVRTSQVSPEVSIDHPLVTVRLGGSYRNSKGEQEKNGGLEVDRRR